MNNRDYKQYAPHTTYHVYNRGVGKMDIFLNKEDYLFFLKRLKEALYPLEAKTMMPIVRQSKQWVSLLPRRKQLPPGAFDLLLYVLMPNHFHFSIVQNTDLPVSALMTKICTSYSKFFNKKYNRVGSLFQDQFKAVIVQSNEQLLWLTAYIHRNPLEAGIVKDLKNYQFSSHLDYVGLRNGTLCKKELIAGQFRSVAEYLESLMNFDDNIFSDDIKVD